MASEAEVRLQKLVDELQSQLNATRVDVRKLHRLITHPSARAYIEKYSVNRTDLGDLLGTANRISVTNGIDAVAKKDNVTLNLPQDIHTGASPNFAWLLWSGAKRVATQFDKADDVLANVTGLSIALGTTKKYFFKAILHVTADAVGGHKYAIGGTVTGTILYQVNTINNATGLFVINSRQTALGGSVGEVGAVTAFTEISGLIVTTGVGTLTVQFAQNVVNGTSSILANSYFIVEQME